MTVDTESVNPDRKTPTYGSPKMGPGAGTAAKMEKNKNEYESMMKKGGEAGSPDFGPASKEELLKRYTKIPAKYTDKKTSGLTVEVGQGKIKKDFVLAD